MLLYPALVLGWLYFLLRGMRWIWLVTLAFFALGFALELVAGPRHWWGPAMSSVALILLLLPVTRRYVDRDPSSLVA